MRSLLFATLALMTVACSNNVTAPVSTPTPVLFGQYIPQTLPATLKADTLTIRTDGTLSEKLVIPIDSATYIRVRSGTFTYDATSTTMTQTMGGQTSAWTFTGQALVNGNTTFIKIH